VNGVVAEKVGQGGEVSSVIDRADANVWPREGEPDDFATNAAASVDSDRGKVWHAKTLALTKASGKGDHGPP
jgi:hypothetical protein